MSTTPRLPLLHLAPDRFIANHTQGRGLLHPSRGRARRSSIPLASSARGGQLRLGRRPSSSLLGSTPSLWLWPPEHLCMWPARHGLPATMRLLRGGSGGADCRAESDAALIIALPAVVRVVFPIPGADIPALICVDCCDEGQILRCRCVGVTPIEGFSAYPLAVELAASWGLKLRRSGISMEEEEEKEKDAFLLVLDYSMLGVVVDPNLRDQYMPCDPPRMRAPVACPLRGKALSDQLTEMTHPLAHPHSDLIPRTPCRPHSRDVVHLERVSF